MAQESDQTESLSERVKIPLTRTEELLAALKSVVLGKEGVIER